MNVSTAKFNKKLNESAKKLKEFATSTKGLILEGLAGYGFYKMIELAGEEERSLNKVKFAFGAFADTVTSQSEKMNLAFGFSRDEFNKSAAGLGSLLKSEGYGEQAAATLSTAFTTVAEKASRMTGVPLEEYLSKIAGAMAGRARGLHEIGIVLSKDAIAAEALRLGLMRMGGEMSDNAKQQATTSLLYTQLQKKTEHYGETVDTISGRMAAFKDRVEEIVQSLAVMLMPLIGPGGQIQEGLAALQMLMDNWGASAVAAGTNVANSVQGQAASIGFLQKSVGYIADAWQLVKIAWYSAQGAMTAGIKLLVDSLGFYAKALDSFFQFLADHGIGKTSGPSGVTTYLETLSQGLDDLNKNQFADLQKQVAAPWAHNDVNSYFDNVRKKMAVAKAELNKPVSIASALKDKSAITPADSKKYELGKASAFGSSESANTILRSQYGNRSAKNADSVKIAANTATANKHLQKIASAVARNEKVFAEIWANF